MRQRVWHVFRFRQRFELADDQRFDRRRPLVYSRDYVTATDDESAGYLRQMDALSRRQNGLELEGAWSRIRRAASARSREYRGYLLDADNRPASDAEIARTILFCEARRASRILKTLADVGLLEQVRCPIFDESQNDVTKAKRKKSPGKKAKGRNPKSGRPKAVSRKTTENHERAREALRAKKERERKTEVRKKKRTESEGVSGSAPDIGRATEPKTQGKPKPKPCPPTTRTEAEGNPTSNPNESEGGGACATPPGEPPHSVNRSDPRQIGNALKLWWADPDCKAFSYDVFEKLGLAKTCDPESREGRSERGTFARWLWKIKTRPDWPTWRDAGLRKAEHVGKRAKGARSPGAIWLEIMGGMTAAKVRAG